MLLHSLFLEQEFLQQAPRPSGSNSGVLPTVIVPGLFGSSINWRGFGKQLASECPVYLLDQRNHGRSPHADSHTYADMIQDLLAFLDQHELSQIVLCGHSMGGKVAMLFALLYPERVAKLIVLDIAPIAYQHSHAPFLQALLDIDLSTLSSRSEADRAVAEAIPDTATRLFLLQSLAGSTGQYFWRLNLAVLYEFMPQIIGFPDGLVCDKQSTVPALFLYGDQSDYVLPEFHKIIRQYFSAAEVAPIEQAGHWLHVQQPAKVLESVKKFIKNDRKQ